MSAYSRTNVNGGGGIMSPSLRANRPLFGSLESIRLRNHGGDALALAAGREFSRIHLTWSLVIVVNDSR